MSRRPRLFLSALAIAAGLLLAAPPAEAGRRRDERQLTAIHEQMLDALRRGDWAGVAAQMHPDELRRFREMLQPIFLQAAAQGEEMPGFFTAGGGAALEALDDAAFFSRFLTGLMASRPGLDATMAGADAEVIGVLFEDREHAHVVYRITMRAGEVSITKLSVTPARRTDGGWAFMLTGEFEGLAQALQAQARSPGR